MTEKAVVSNRIYFKASPEKIKEIAGILTYKIDKEFNPSGSIFDAFEILKTYKIVTPGIISVPQGRFDLVPKDYEIVDKRILVPIDLPAPKFNLYPEQQIIYEQVDDTCFINALVGWGKTFTALWLAYKFGQKTLVITHTTALRDQWVKEVEKLFGFKPDIIGSGIFETSTPIVIGNVQTITKNVLALSKMFGTIILDECHHVAATTFSHIIDNMHARYRIGLSGTRRRKDKKHVIFDDYFGFKLFIPPKSNTIDPTIYIYKTGVSLSGNTWVNKINNLLYDNEYQDVVAAIAAKKAVEGYKVLILANRVEFLQQLYQRLEPYRFALVYGQTKNRDDILQAVIDDELDGIVGSTQIFSEGISNNPLSCLIMPVPSNNDVLLEQVIGRVMRKHVGKLDPIVIDFHFAGRADRKQNNARLAFYMDKGWNIVNI